MKGYRDAQTGLTASEERFCIELVKPDTSQADAYRCAFPKSRKWADKTVWARASELAKKSKVRGRVRELMDQVTTVGIMDATETMLLLSRVARADLRKCYRPDGTLKAPHEIDDETAAGLMSLETVEEARGEGRKRLGLARKVRLLNRVDALDKLMRYHGQYHEDNRQKADVIKQFMEAVSGKSRGLPKPLQ